MKRRQFMALSALAFVTTSCSSWADETSHVDFTQEGYEKALASGEPFMLDFYAPW